MFSHPNKELKEHLENVKILGLKIFENRKTIWSNNKKIKRILEIILETHDYGKATKYFQEYIQNTESDKYKQTPYKDYKKHGEFSALWTYYLILKEFKDEKLALISYMIVKKHHGNLTNFKDENIVIFHENKVFEKQYQTFDFNYFNLEKEKENFKNFVYTNMSSSFKFTKKIRNLKKEFSEEDYILCNFLFSILISADKGEAIFYDKGEAFDKLKELKEKKIKLNKNLVDEYKKNTFTKNSKVNEYREKIYSDIEKTLLLQNLEKNKIFSINVPTGTGKTLSSLNAALKLRDKIGLDSRIIYTLPFTSIIDQNYKIFEEVLLNENSTVLLKHHYLAEKEYKVNNNEVYEYDISNYLIENWDSEIIVTTFVQLLDTIFTNKNKKLKKYHNFANSILILDEVQSIPHKYWKVINKILRKMTETLNCYIILVTATMPLIFNEKELEIIELASKKDEYFKFFNRIKLNKTNLNKEIDLEEFQNIIYEDINNNKNKSFLFVMNTIKSSLKLYEFIKNRFNNKEIVYLSTNIIPKERLKRIEKIKNSKKCIVVSTQLVEAGVDIDLDIVYRDFGPLDVINQVSGRCNRNGRKKEGGVVKLFSLKDEKGRKYSSYIYGDFLNSITKEVLVKYKDIIEEKDFSKIAFEYFKKLDDKKSNDTSNKLLESIKKLNYDEINIELILKNFKTVDLFIDIDDESKKLWSEYKKIYGDNNLSIYERRAKFNKIKSRFLNYVISIPEKYYKEGIEGFNLIDEYSLKQYYDNETGFKREEKQEDYFF